jgi:chromosome segregation ATPase
VVKEISRVETEIEIIKQKVTDIDRQIKSLKDSTADQQAQMTKYEKELSEMDKQLALLNKTRDELQSDLKEAETQAFTGFLQKIGFKTLNEYEASRSNEQVKVINERKNTLMQRIERNQYELSLIDNQGGEITAIQKIEAALKLEEEKLQALLSDAANSSYVQKLKAELQVIESDL